MAAGSGLVLDWTSKDSYLHVLDWTSEETCLLLNLLWKYWQYSQVDKSYWAWPRRMYQVAWWGGDSDLSSPGLTFTCHPLASSCRTSPGG